MKANPWYMSFWHSRKWVIGTLIMLVLCAMRWYEHLGDGTFGLLFPGIFVIVVGGSEYSKRTESKKPEEESIVQKVLKLVQDKIGVRLNGVNPEGPPAG
jgi:hypothetical protein